MSDATELLDPGLDSGIELPEEQEPKVEVPDIFNFQKILPRLKGMISDWNVESKVAARNRKMRKLDVDLDALRKDGKLKADETFIPIRVIDTNIKQEQPPFNAYLTQSRRLAVFEVLNLPDGKVDTQEIEKEFTKGMTYIGWQTPFFSAVDGSQLHGWDNVEVEYDDTKPFKVNVNFIGHENLIFPVDNKDLQAAEILIVAYDFTILKLQEFIDKGWFKEDQGTKLKNSKKEKGTENYKDESFKLYKKYCKYDGVVYYSWFTDDNACDDWLHDPEKLFQGRKRQEKVWKDVPVTLPDPMTGYPVQINQKQQVLDWVPIYETLYPIHQLQYQKTEEADITETKGRAWLDGPKQEAQTCLWSNFVNGSTRASNIYASPKTGQGGKPYKMELELEPGSVYSESIDFWSPPMPSFDLIRASQSLDTQTQIETGRVAFAAINNQDSRKTAKEVSAAEQQNQLLTSVQVTLYSIFLCSVWNNVWTIVQSLALQGVIPFLSQGRDEATGLYINDTQKISLDYKLMPAGQVDVVERAELQAKREKMWPIIVGIPQLIMNPLAIQFVKDMVEENFPEDSAEYMATIDAMVQQAQQQQTAVQNLLGVIQTSAQAKEPVTPEEAQKLIQTYTQQPQPQQQAA